MKVSYHVKRTGSAKHNDRSFDISLAKHINPELVSDNRYIKAYKETAEEGPMSFEEVEKRFYTNVFTPWLDKRNKKARQQRHKERIKTVDQLLTDYNTRPEEAIYQIGDKDNYPADPKLLEEIYIDLNKYSHQLVGRHCRVLDVALHMDEATPHIHERRVWVYRDPADKLYKISQSKALERAGIPLPHPDQPEGRLNNRKMTYDRMIREKFIDLCRQHGLEIEDNPSRRKHLSKTDYIYRQQCNEMEAMQEVKDKTPISIQERVELEELRRLRQELEATDPDFLDRIRRQEYERRRRKEVARKRAEREHRTNDK